MPETLTTTTTAPRRAPDFVPEAWTRTSPTRPATRDVALDLLRGLAIVILVVNHLRLDSPVGALTSSVLSAAEILVAVSGVVAGMVFGQRWRTLGARATTGLLLRRARKLYLASLVVVALVGLLTLVPFLHTDALTLTTGPDEVPPKDLYAFDSAWRTALAIVTLEAGPWQFSILGFFIAALAVTPLLLRAMHRGHWALLLGASWALYAAGRAWPVDVLPSQSERPFPLLVWQGLFVHGLLLGWHRDRIARALRRRRCLVCRAVLGVALLAAATQLIAPALMSSAGWSAWEAAHFAKSTLDPARLVAMVSIAAATYIAFARHGALAERLLGPVLLPLGRNSFYVFIVHVFVCLAVASVPAVGTGAAALAVNSALSISAVALLWLMTTHRFLFRWIPR